MIIASIIGFTVGALMATAMASLYHFQRVHVMKGDVIIALQEQAAESFRTGYRTGLLDEREAQNKMADARRTFRNARL